MKVHTVPSPIDFPLRIALTAESYLEKDFLLFIQRVLQEGQGSMILHDETGKQIASYEHGFGVSLR